jgi:hypothetical protein
MSRPLRLEFAGALYHVTARGNAREDVFRDDAERLRAWPLSSAPARRTGIAPGLSFLTLGVTIAYIENYVTV